MSWTDTHAHLHFPEFAEDLKSVFENASARGVRTFMNVGTNLECSRRAVQFAEKHENVYAAIGCHPHDSKDFKDGEMEEFRKLAKHPKVKAIGEVGLDFFRDHSPRGRQEEVFRLFVRLHKETGLPLILHIREAHADTFRVLEEEAPEGVRAVMHCFSGDREVLEKANRLGMWVSFAGNVTYKKSVLKETVPFVPKDRIVVETDCPFLAPEGFRGKRNEPAYLPETGKFLAGLLGMAPEEFAEATTRNAAEFFRLKESR